MNTASSLPLYCAPPEDLDATRGVEFIEMPVRKILNRCDSPRMPFRWTINPYRGCEFGCVYCYARYTHDFLELRDPMDFERQHFRQADGGRGPVAHALAHADRLRRDRDRHGDRPLSAGRAQVRAHALDARGFRATRRARPLDHHQVGLVVRDLDLLRKINRRSKLSVNFSLMTLDRKLQRTLEPRAPRPELRLRALFELAARESAATS